MPGEGWHLQASCSWLLPKGHLKVLRELLAPTPPGGHPVGAGTGSPSPRWPSFCPRRWRDAANCVSNPEPSSGFLRPGLPGAQPFLAGHSQGSVPQALCSALTPSAALSLCPHRVPQVPLGDSGQVQACQASSDQTGSRKQGQMPAGRASASLQGEGPGDTPRSHSMSKKAATALPLLREISPPRIIVVGITRNCRERLGHHKKDRLLQLSLCFPTVITSVINLCHLTVLHFEKRKWKKDQFQTNLHHSLRFQNRVKQMSDAVLSKLVSLEHRVQRQQKAALGAVPCGQPGTARSCGSRCGLLQVLRASPPAERRLASPLMATAHQQHPHLLMTSSQSQGINVFQQSPLTPFHLISSFQINLSDLVYCTPHCT